MITLDRKEFFDIIFGASTGYDIKQDLAVILARQVKYDQIGSLILDYFGVKTQKELEERNPDAFEFIKTLFGLTIWRLRREVDKI